LLPEGQRLYGARPGTTSVVGREPGACDVGARPRAAHEEALCDQPVVGHRHRATRDAELPGQVAGPRESVARAQAAVEHRRTDGPVDPGAPVAGAFERDVEVHWRRGSSA